MNLSIVTIHLNDFHGLKNTFVSLRRARQRVEYQWILIDGESELRTPNEGDVKQRVSEYAEVYVSEPDKGMYDAMNKGTALATGDYVLYLNAGDELHPDFDLAELQRELGSQTPAMIWGTCHERYPSGELVKVKNRSPRLSWYGMPANHQNILFRRKLLDDAPYDTNYEFLADYDLVGRLIGDGGKVFRTDMPVAIFQRGGAHFRNLRRTLAEEATLRTKHFGVPRVISWALLCWKLTTAQLGRVPVLRRLLRRWV